MIKDLDRSGLAAAAVLVLLVAGSWWLAQGDGKPPAKSDSAGGSPDYYLEGFKVTTMGGDGKPARELAAESLYHYPDDGRTELAGPNLFFFENSAPPWKVRAEKGLLSGDGATLLLQDEVKIERTGDKDIRPLFLTTHDLRIYPGKHYAETESSVRIRSLDDQLEAVGMQAWFEKPVRLKFLSNVRGHHEIQ